MSQRDDARASLGGTVAGFTVLGLLVLLLTAWVALFVYAGDRAPRSARVEGVDISHLDPGAAEEKLRGVLEARARQPIEVTYGDGRTRGVDPATAGISIDYPASIDAAGGGSGWSLRRLWQVASGGGDHRAVVTVDEPKLQTALDALAQGIATPPVDGTVVFRGGRASGVPGRPGLVVDRSAARDMLVARFLHQGSQKLPTTVSAPVVTADEVNRVVGEFGGPAMSGPVTVVLPGRRVVVPPAVFGRALSTRVQDGRLVPQVDGDVLMSALTPLVPGIAPTPVDASVVLRGGRPVVVPGRAALTADTDRLASDFGAVLTRRGAARRVVVPAQVQQPAFGTAAAQALGITQRVGSAQARFPWADYRNVALTRAAAKVDGTLLRPGDTLDLASVVGADTAGTLTPLVTATMRAVHAPVTAGVQPAALTTGPGGTVPPQTPQFVNASRYGVLLSATVRPATPHRPGLVTVTEWSARR